MLILFYYILLFIINVINIIFIKYRIELSYNKVIEVDEKWFLPSCSLFQKTYFNYLLIIDSYWTKELKRIQLNQSTEGNLTSIDM